MNQPGIKRQPRRGYTIIVVLALAALATTMFVGWAREAVRVHRATKDRHARVQADWLVHAGFGRAAAALRRNADYQGETWLLSPQQLGQPDAAEVRIEVAPAGDGATITCRVRLPPGDNRRVQRTRSLVLPTVSSRPIESPTDQSRTSNPNQSLNQGDPE